MIMPAGLTTYARTATSRLVPLEQPLARRKPTPHPLFLTRWRIAMTAWVVIRKASFRLPKFLKIMPAEPTTFVRIAISRLAQMEQPPGHLQCPTRWPIMKIV
jgi:hypothetical protein